MSKTRKILWVDDEIEFLKSHVIFLNDRGYNVVSISNGYDALERLKVESFDLILIDEIMPGMDGISTIENLRKANINIPIIMITKSEEDSLVEQAIISDVINFLVKPVSPIQVYIACKAVLESNSIITDNVIKEFLSFYKELNNKFISASQFSEWEEIYSSLVEWDLKISDRSMEGLDSIISEQYQVANKNFERYIKENYSSWIENKSTNPILSKDIMNHYIFPDLKENKKTAIIILDCLRLDQWTIIEDELKKKYNIDTKYALSMLPSTSLYSRNSIFSGVTALDLSNDYPDQWKLMNSKESNMNAFEEDLLKENLMRNNLGHKSIAYSKINNYKDGASLLLRISEYNDKDLIAVVVNFVDILGHSRSESQIIKEIVPTEKSFRKTVLQWFNDSWISDLLNRMDGRKIIFTTDHGSVKVGRPIAVSADRETSSGLRYKKGKNIKISEKDGLLIRDPEKYGLPKSFNNENFILACADKYLLYPNDYNYYARKFEDSFQHGGISLEEMLLPVGILDRS